MQPGDAAHQAVNHYISTMVGDGTQAQNPINNFSQALQPGTRNTNAGLAFLRRAILLDRVSRRLQRLGLERSRRRRSTVRFSPAKEGSIARERCRNHISRVGNAPPVSVKLRCREKTSAWHASANWRSPRHSRHCRKQRSIDWGLPLRLIATIARFVKDLLNERKHSNEPA